MRTEMDLTVHIGNFGQGGITMNASCVFSNVLFGHWPTSECNIPAQRVTTSTVPLELSGAGNASRHLCERDCEARATT